MGHLLFDPQPQACLAQLAVSRDHCRHIHIAQQITGSENAVFVYTAPAVLQHGKAHALCRNILFPGKHQLDLLSGLQNRFGGPQSQRFRLVHILDIQQQLSPDAAAIGAPGIDHSPSGAEQRHGTLLIHRGDMVLAGGPFHSGPRLLRLNHRGQGQGLGLLHVHVQLVRGRFAIDQDGNARDPGQDRHRPSGRISGARDGYGPDLRFPRHALGCQQTLRRNGCRFLSSPFQAPAGENRLLPRHSDSGQQEGLTAGNRDGTFRADLLVGDNLHKLAAADAGVGICADQAEATGVNTQQCVPLDFCRLSLARDGFDGPADCRPSAGPVRQSFRDQCQSGQGKILLYGCRHMGKIEEIEISAAAEGVPADALQIPWQLCHQTGATVKGITTDSGDRLRNLNLTQIFTPGKQGLGNLVDFHRYRNSFQGFTGLKCRTANAIQFIRQLHLFQRPAMGKGGTSNGGKLFRQLDHPEAGAILKGIILNSVNALRNRNGPQGRTALKGGITDSLQFPWQRHTVQGLAAVECAAFDSAHLFRNLHFYQRSTVFKGRHANFGDTVRKLDIA